MKMGIRIATIAALAVVALAATITVNVYTAEAGQPAKVNNLSGHIAVGIDDDAQGSLAPLGSFEFQAAPAYTKLANIRHEAAAALRGQHITKEHAQQVQQSADQVRALLDSAVKTCGQNNKTGACTGSGPKAHKLLREAQVKLAAIH